jgi:putative ABC transport system substrate-binding protein
MTRSITSFSAIVTLALIILMAPLAAAAQQTRTVPRLGYLENQSASDADASRFLEAFRQGLRELGYVEGQSLALEYRLAEGKLERLPDLAAELVRLKVDVIVTWGPGIHAAKRATTTLPIVMASTMDAVGGGLVASLARPGGNITGLTVQDPGLHAKTLELLKETLPQLSRVALLWEATGAGIGRRELEDAARSLGVQLQTLEVRSPEELPRAFQKAVEGRAEALHVAETAMLGAHLPQIADLAVKSRLPAIGQLRPSAEAGLLMSYGPDVVYLFRRAAMYVDKILKGAKPADLPVERPMKFELVINLKTAKALGITIPSTLLFQADEVIR